MSTSIEWTDETWNPLVGCSRVSPGCDHCYAIGVAHRGMSLQHRGLTIKRPGDRTDWTGEVREVPHLLEKPSRWRRPRRIFVNSLSDLFHRDVRREYIAEVWAAMVAADWHTYQVLTKRPRRMAALLADHDFRSEVERIVHERWETHMFAGFVRPTIWVGTSIETDRYTYRADHLRATPAAVRFLSLEPLLGPLPSLDLTGIDWVIVGGESGPGARPMHPDWARDIRDHCVEAGIPFLFKQWGSIVDADQMPADTFVAVDAAHNLAGNPQRVWNVGKKAAGRELDGRTWDEFPAVTA